MRQETIDYINTLALGGFLLTQELPFEENGEALYVKNPKKIYVSVPEYENQPVVTALNGLNINNETTVIRLYFSCDAKTLPSNYDTLVTDLKATKDITTIDGVNRRECVITTDMVNDLLVTELEVRFTKIST